MTYLLLLPEEPDELGESDEPGLLPLGLLPELLLPGLVLLLSVLSSEEDPPGVSPAPVAEPLPDKPKCEKMLCRQPG